MEFSILRPDPGYLLHSVRSFGYSVETAIADLIDNSITAMASDIKITFGIDNYTSYVRIEDDGTGMTEDELNNAMKIGSFNPLNTRQENDLGRFGLGLKTASFSQCRRLTVKTKSEGGKLSIRCWDLDLVTEKNDWVLLCKCFDRNSEKNVSEISSNRSGTIILWENLDRLTESDGNNPDKEHFYRKFCNVRNHLGLIFHRFIEDKIISIKVLDDYIQPINPFNISYEIPSTELPEEQLSINNQPITIQPFILPHESKLTPADLAEVNSLRGITDHQGIYLYRNRRLIIDGSWLDLGLRKKENQRLCRVRIDIPNSLDKEWQIDVRKTSAKVPDIIRKRIMSICVRASEQSIRVYTHRGAYLRRHSNNRNSIPLWRTKQKKLRKFYEINKKHPIYLLICGYLESNANLFTDFIKLVEESLPVSFIVSDFSDPKIVMKGYFEESESELERIYHNTIKTLTEFGMTESEAIEQANSLDCFNALKKRRESDGTL